jgi:hypothetical protein
MRLNYGEIKKQPHWADLKKWSRHADLNCRPLPYHGSALPLSYDGTDYNYLFTPPLADLINFSFSSLVNDLISASLFIAADLVLKFSE